MTSTTNPFSEYYKTIGDSELVFILENIDDYQEIAVQAARLELDRRQVSAGALENLKAALDEQKEAAEIMKKKKEHVRLALKTGSLTLVESLNPIHAELPAAEKILRYIIILWGIFMLISLISDYRWIFQSLKEFPFHPFINSLILFPYIILPVSLYYLSKRESLGWTLFLIFLTVSLFSDLIAFENALTWKPSGIKWMDEAFKPSLFKTFRQLLMVGGTCYAICRGDMKELFSIEDKQMWMTIGITAVVCFLSFIGLRYQ